MGGNTESDNEEIRTRSPDNLAPVVKKASELLNVTERLHVCSGTHQVNGLSFANLCHVLNDLIYFLSNLDGEDLDNEDRLTE
jgi:hypothetical protein